MEFIDIELGDSVMLIRDPQGDCIARLPFGGSSDPNTYGMSIQVGDNATCRYRTRTWTLALADELKAKGYGYVPIRSITMHEHAHLTYVQNATTDANVRAALIAAKVAP
jgi:hypothetical protein